MLPATSTQTVPTLTDRMIPKSKPAASFAYPLNSTVVRALGYGSLSADGFFPQLHADDLTLLPQQECGGLQTAYGRWWATAPSDSGPSPQACTGECAGRKRLAGMARLAARLATTGVYTCWA